MEIQTICVGIVEEAEQELVDETKDRQVMDAQDVVNQTVKYREVEYIKKS